MFAESETVRKRVELEALLEELDRKKDEAKRDIRELHEKLDQVISIVY